jgi:drug/metabolite transporter (DMT)-like permease
VPFLGVRFLAGALVLVPFTRNRPKQAGLRAAAFAVGAALLAGYVFQTVGLQYTTGSVSAFITYLLVVLVPIISALVIRRAPDPPTIAGVVVATAGLFLMTGHTFHLGRGEILTMGCALAFAFHVVLLAEYSPRFDFLRLHAGQLLVVGLVCAIAGVFSGGYHFTAKAWLAALYTGVAVSGIGLCLQVWAQQKVGPTRTALLLTLEPVFAAVAGYVAGDRLGWTGLAGATLILLGIVLAEVVGPSWWEARQPADGT